jgi:hypothetical protein
MLFSLTFEWKGTFCPLNGMCKWSTKSTCLDNYLNKDDDSWMSSSLEIKKSYLVKKKKIKENENNWLSQKVFLHCHCQNARVFFILTTYLLCFCGRVVQQTIDIPMLLCSSSRLSHLSHWAWNKGYHRYSSVCFIP